MLKINSKAFIIFIIQIVFFLSHVNAQTSFPPLDKVFKDDEVARVDILIDPDSLQLLYDNINGNYNFPITIIFKNSVIDDTIYNAAIGLRGNTSLSSQKKSFQITFNGIVASQSFYGLDKMNLNGEHNDPSIIRSKLCWDILRKMEVPAPRSNHVAVYINGNYYGLYINVEHIDDNFSQSRFGNNNGNLYKCTYGADLTFLGSNPNNYMQPCYELKINDANPNYGDLIYFIDVLNNTSINNLPCELDKIFDVDSYLRAMAFDILTGNWDGPLYNKNNFFLYHNTFTGKFEYMPYDLDNTFGIDWFGEDWAARNIYTWSETGEQRPLYTRLLQVPEYKARYSYYLEKTCNDYFNSTVVFPHIDSLKNMIQTYAENDIYRTLDYGYSIDDFNNSYVQNISGPSTYGLKPFITARRSSALSQLINYSQSPILTQLNHNYPQPNENILFNVQAEDNNLQSVILNYSINNSSSQTQAMFDDGLHNDVNASDGIFGISIVGLNALDVITFYVQATDASSNSSRIPFCINDTLFIAPPTPALVINEFMALNNLTIADDYNEFDDWVEIYNADVSAVYLGNKFLTDDISNRTQWQLPNITLQPNQYFLTWCDKDGTQGVDHANFKLSADSGIIALIDAANNSYTIIDSVNYSQQTADVAYARVPNAIGDFIKQQATPDYNNDAVLVVDTKLEIKFYPNPVMINQSIKIYSTLIIQSICIYDVTGRKILTQDLSNRNIEVFIDKKFVNGIYWVDIIYESGAHNRMQFIKQ